MIYGGMEFTLGWKLKLSFDGCKGHPDDGMMLVLVSLFEVGIVTYWLV